jgi:hypothetical protein
MEKTNYDFLCEDLKFLGFGDTLKRSLKEGMGKNQNAFELYFVTEIDNEPVHAILNFIRPEESGFFFFSGYQLALPDKIHYFKVFKGKGITLKEGFNLLCGRAVFKQLIGKNGQKYDAWMQFDLNAKEGANYKINTYYGGHGYNLSACFDAFPIETPSVNWDRTMLLRSLEKGNLQSAFLKENGILKRVLIEADPKEKRIIIHDSMLLPESPVKWESNGDEASTEAEEKEKSFKKKK